MSLRIETIRECLEGIIPGHIATCDTEGMPNLAYLSQVQFIDNEHVALSYQFLTVHGRMFWRVLPSIFCLPALCQVFSIG